MTTSRSIAWVLAGVLAGAGGCAREAASTADQPAAERPSDERSIFDLDLDLVDQDARALTLADLGDRAMVAAMVYSTCTTVCPRITEDMKTLEARLPDAAKGDVRFALFSIDPGRDTPEALRAFATDHKLDTSRWRLMAASEDDVRDLAAALGVRYSREENGEFAHSAMIFVIDKAGIVRHRQVGVGQDAGEIIAALTAARR
jgi:protein SCO1/2